MEQPFLYIRALRHAEHTVFCVQDGQKSYWNSQFNVKVPYSSGQQVKRSILDAVCTALGTGIAPITFNKVISDKEGGLKEGEPWSPCDPTYPDQLLGGWMRAIKGDIAIKRRSPLSISAMRPIHPLLAGITKENATFDRSDNPDRHPVIVSDGKGRQLSDEEVLDFLQSKGRTLTRRNYIQDLTRADGLFVYDVAIDLRTLFAVSLNQHEPEMKKETIEKLRADGWGESVNNFGKCLIAPKSMREKIIPALAAALINWRITSNQARTFSLMEILAVAISDNANQVAGSIRATLSDENEKCAIPVIDEAIGAKIFKYVTIDGFIRGQYGTANALSEAEKYIENKLREYSDTLN